MTHRERMLAAIDGQPVDRVPWAPRMDLWCIALRARGVLPRRFAGRNTREIADLLGAACHAVRADYTLPRKPEDFILRGLGIDNHRDYPYRVELRDFPCEFLSDSENVRTRIRTPAGEVVMHLQTTLEMKRNGISLPFVKRYPITTTADFEAVARVFEHLEVIPTPESYAAFRRRIGEAGLAVASGPIAASPVHLILHELVPMDRFFYLHHDEPKALSDLAARLAPFFEACLDALLACEAETVFWGGNYDRDLTWPPFFEAEIAPWLRRVADRVHAAGKRLVTHADGENDGLLPLYPACGFDVAESVCPAPMTRLSLADLRKGFCPATVWGGIPSVALLDDAMSDAEFERTLDALIDGLGDGRRLILGVSDNVPPDARLDRLRRIGDRAASFTPARPVRSAAPLVGARP